MKSFKKEIGIFIGVTSLFMIFLFIIGKEDGEALWQINADACVTCGLCETNCIKAKSAVVAVIDSTKEDTRIDCPGFFKSTKAPLDTSRANQICPTGALVRNVINDSTAEYSIDESRCVGCGKCVAGCKRKCVGAISLVVDPSECLDCNTCSIAEQCPAKAVGRGN